jgi:hypothetical protein
MPRKEVNPQGVQQGLQLEFGPVRQRDRVAHDPRPANRSEMPADQRSATTANPAVARGVTQPSARVPRRAPAVR